MKRLGVLLLIVGCTFWTMLLCPTGPKAAALPCGVSILGCGGADACKNPPIPEMPGAGFAGWIDQGPTTYDPAATGIYDTMQYPPPWSTFDLGCGPGAVRNPDAVMSTTIGNWEKGAATALIALCNSLHRLTSPPAFLTKLDPILVKGSTAVHDAVFTPYIGLTLLAVAGGIIVSARKRDMSRALEAVVWALGVLTVAIAVWQYPVRISHGYQRFVTTATENIEQHFAGTHGKDPATARANLLVDSDLWRQWCAGELGDADSRTSRKYCLRLAQDQKFSYAEKAAADKNLFNGWAITTAKKKDFLHVAKLIQKEDPAAYQHLKGEASGRMGQGFVSLLSTVLTVPFMIAADIVKLIALLLMWFILIGFPAIAVFGVFIALRGLVIGTWLRAGAGFINAGVFTIGSSVNTLVVSLLLGTDTGLPGWFTIALAGVVAFLLWALLRPFRKLGAMVNPNSLARTGSQRDPFSRKYRRRMRRAMRRPITVNTGKRSDDGNEEPRDVDADTPVVRERPETRSREAVADATGWSAPSYSSGAATSTRVGSPVPTPLYVPPIALPPRSARPSFAEVLPDPAAPPREQYDDPTSPPRYEAAGRRSRELNPGVDVWERGEMPTEPRRADPVVDKDGKMAWRVWDPDTRTFVDARKPKCELCGGTGAFFVDEDGEKCSQENAVREVVCNDAHYA